MSTLLETIGTFFTWVVGKIPELLDLIVSEPLLTLGVAMMVAGAVFSYCRRMISLS